jgi:hypothetical protein
MHKRTMKIIAVVPWLRPITIIGLTADGKTREFTGMVHSVESGHTLHPGYPLRVTMLDSN